MRDTRREQRSCAQGTVPRESKCWTLLGGAQFIRYLLSIFWGQFPAGSYIRFTPWASGADFARGAEFGDGAARIQPYKTPVFACASQKLVAGTKIKENDPVKNQDEEESTRLLVSLL